MEKLIRTVDEVPENLEMRGSLYFEGIVEVLRAIKTELSSRGYINSFNSNNGGEGVDYYNMKAEVSGRIDYELR